MRNFVSTRLSNADKIAVGQGPESFWIRIEGHGEQLSIYLNERQAVLLRDLLITHTA